MPDALGADGAEIRYAINGLLSLTPDGGPLLGETPEVKGLWSAAAVWIKEGPGVGRAVAEWMTHGHSEIDVHHADIARFYPHQRTRAYVRSRTSEAFNKTYGIVHPGEQWSASAASASRRCTRRSGPRARSSSRPSAGSGRSGTSPTRPCSASTATGSCRASTSGTPAGGRRSSTPSTSRCASGPASSTCPRSRSSTSSGRRAAQAVQSIVVAQADVADGRVIYTPVLDAKGGFRSDLTVMRLAHDRYRVVTGGAHGMADLKWFADHLPADGAARRRPDLGVHHDRAVGPAGPRHPRPPHRRRHLARGVPVPHLPAHRAGQRRGAGLADLLRRRAGLGALRPDGAGRAGVGPAARGRRRRRRRPGRHRRLRHHRAAGEGLPGLRVRARRRADDRRGRDGAAEGQGRRLRGPRGLPRAARGRAAGRCCAR